MTMLAEAAQSSSSVSSSSSRTTSSSVPVLIAGGGPVGLYEALLLTKLGIKVRVIERETSVSPMSKALGMQARSLEILDMTGSIDRFLEQGQPITELNLWSMGRKVATLPVVGTSESNHSYGLFLEQAKTSHIFIKELKELGVEIDYGWEVMDTKVVHESTPGGEKTSYVETTIRRALSGDNNAPGEKTAIGVVDEREEQEGKEYEIEVIRSEYMVAADGGRSTVRHKLNIPFPGRTLDFKTLMWDGTYECALDFPGINFMRGANKKTFILFPLSDGNVRAVVEDGFFAPEEKWADSMKNTTIERFEELASATLGTPFKIKTTNWLTCYKVNERRAGQFIYQDRIFLAGDSAHVHSPAGGQGLNTGLQDAHNLAWKLAMVLNGVAPPALLASYDERKPMADRAIELSSFLLHRNRATGFIADIRAFLLTVVGPLLGPLFQISFFRPEVAMLKVRYVENSLNKPHPKQPKPEADFQVGVRAADGPLVEVIPGKGAAEKVGTNETSTRLQSLLKGVGRFHIVVFTSDTFASPKRALSAKPLAENMDHFLTEWRKRWFFSTTLRDGFEDTDLFKAHVVAGSVSSDVSGLELLMNKSMGNGKVFVDNTKVLHQRYGCAWNRGQGGIIVVRPDSHIGFRVNGFDGQAWKDVDEYLRSILV
ncbi:phenol 2-monooxygenase (NADPH) [Entomortierella parvispora]|uniref:Phenol 2-monooxygenase (NADPH) n=1 Tax=Entomortierella parvispora TaxID=205924 RepID=A0A9P3LVT3_9FUNG|nr:phenol 2-monooxygenase (NADPH) [Entomortierella parvispora]